MEIENKVRNILLELGVPCNVQGYRYIKQAVMLMLYDNFNNCITKELYPKIAKMNDTTSNRVERSIRHAIETTFKNIDTDVSKKYFGNSINPNNGKPCNSQFIATIVEYIKDMEI